MADPVDQAVQASEKMIAAKRAEAQAHLKANTPTDLETGKPATRPPSGANVVDPMKGTMPPSVFPARSSGSIGTRNESIYPEK